MSTSDRSTTGTDRIFEPSESRASDFEFSEDVAAVFDEMVRRSVPFYTEQQRMIQEVAATAHLESGTV